jgi:hypothetical protein
MLSKIPVNFFTEPHLFVDCSVMTWSATKPRKNPKTTAAELLAKLYHILISPNSSLFSFSAFYGHTCWPMFFMFMDVDSLR